ncbi:TIGR04219 family outer membrane beta-barrel protein [Colwellia sp. E2M01]|uniref:TIGR04219 family outer membrane beta-barrel protein n=1 Tax=Colwellia sp. E2M01 TaxID=2841561 RepID=UPI001C09DE3D|nr:TIGR04219 family outer membrane beta-barrel protein [Colwellia sp. E2M01]MBU2871808.1 TIGR04219 family outer membrane beta-barrel protein [Colwellia sp. E2M01]
MNKLIFSTIITALFTVNAQAAFTFTPQENNTVGLSLGGQFWQSQATGLFGENNNLIDFNLKEALQINYFVAIEHPYSLLPNIRIANTSLDTTGKTTLTQAFSFDGEPFAIGDEVNASFNVSYIDYTLYYELFDNEQFSFDLGLSARDFGGGVTVAGPPIIEDGEPDRTDWHESCYDENGDLKGDCSLASTSRSVTPTGKIKTDDIVPMLYMATNIGLPLTRLSVFAQADLSLTDEHSLSDYQAGFSYDLIHNRTGKYNLTLGYRVVNMAFTDINNLYTELDFKGVFVGVIGHF